MCRGSGLGGVGEEVARGAVDGDCEKQPRVPGLQSVLSKLALSPKPATLLELLGFAKLSP